MYYVYLSHIFHITYHIIFGGTVGRVLKRTMIGMLERIVEGMLNRWW